MNLLEVLSNENKKKVVRTLLQYPDRQWNIAELEASAKTPHATTWRTVKDLERLKVLNTIPIGRKVKLIRLIKDSPLIKQLKILLGTEILPQKEIAKKFVQKIGKFKEVYSCILFGSVARCTAKPESDVDFLIITKNKPKKDFKNAIDIIVSQMTEKTYFSLIVDTMSLKEFNKMVKNKHPFVENIIKEGVVLFGKRPFRRG